MLGHAGSLWAKTDDDGNIHLLVYHLIDVAAVAHCMWQESLGEAIKRYFSCSLQLDLDRAGRLLAFWIGLHDIGKASPAFQCKHLPAVDALAKQGFGFDQPNSSVPHGWITARILGHKDDGLLHQQMGLHKRQAMEIARAVGGHHGSWPIPGEVSSVTLPYLGSGVWQDARLELFAALQGLFGPPSDIPPDILSSEKEANAFLTVLSGFTSVTDWIGSMTEFFPYNSTLLPLEQYARKAAEQAYTALVRTGWLSWKSEGVPLSFEQLFPDLLGGPNTIQKQVIQVTDNLRPPALVILESTTGSGKTESSFHLADRWIQQGRGQGLYIAMPTQATSNQMFDRACRFLAQRYRDYDIEPRLLHSQAKWRDNVAHIRPNNLYEEGQNGDSRSNRAAYGWFLPKKRGLLAPFAVGTVDQVLLSILPTRHFFVRLFGLSHKVVIFDEVHAYDTYMGALFERLLQWLGAIGTSVIVLSATLPRAKRRKLIEAFTGKAETAADDKEVSYPCLTVVTQERARLIPLASPDQPRVVYLDYISSQPNDIASRLQEELSDGGCAVVIANTVARAQEIYRAVSQARVVADEWLLLFHARFPFAWRQKIEEAVLNRFSRSGDRPYKAILIATQVVEQSLDLDFDLMITEPAPIDLLIQRMGRLHRHDRPRPKILTTPRLLIMQPDSCNGVPDFGANKAIYGRFLLLASWLTLGYREYVMLPDDITTLIETVYGEGWRNLPLLEHLTAAREEEEMEQRQRMVEANIREILPPDHQELLTQRTPSLAEDDPEIHQRFAAKTRLIESGISVICLHQTRGCLALEPEGDLFVDPKETPSAEQIKCILQHTVEIRDRRIFNYILHADEHQLPEAWQPALDLVHHYIAIFVDGRCPIRGTQYVLQLTRNIGLEVIREEE